MVVDRKRMLDIRTQMQRNLGKPEATSEDKKNSQRILSRANTTLNLQDAIAEKMTSEIQEDFSFFDKTGLKDIAGLLRALPSPTAAQIENLRRMEEKLQNPSQPEDENL
jgi:hypothetical protein